ncbi:hypothetical protein JCM9140_3303 [Halalkalibacter wakoensis JCM 9140]|uniref:Thioesterase domain-containing protein n=2 Tax=Halalkalibacter wakoensis TaxID=127891 RepID=W4Q5A8_9BACI|nr:hypothetical protein JCM9140_3303 [Halalkalibacter wakoensis JCM 9140]
MDMLDSPPSKRGPFSNHLNFDVNLNHKKVITTLKVEEFHLNNKGIVHGGVMASMMDNVIGDSIAMAVNCPVITISLTINYLAPVKLGALLTATGEIIQQGYKIATAEGFIKDQEGQLVAKGVATFKIIRSK